MSSPPPWNPYEVLGVTKDAELEAIKKTYRKLVIKCHPDKIQDEALRAKANDEFHRVQRSYEILSDPVERKRYDNQMRLLELKAEQISRGGGYGSPREMPRAANSSSPYEVRNGRVYEERIPDSVPRFFDDEPRYYEEPRASARKYDGYERRQSESKATEKKKTKTVEVKLGGLFGSKERVHEVSHSDRKKTRDKERRGAASDKYSSTRSAYVEDVSDDSDGVSYFSVKPEPRRRYEEPTPRKAKPEPKRSKESRRSRDDDFDDEWDIKHRDAQEYIQRSRGSAPVEIDRREDRRPSMPRTSSSRYYEVEAEPPPRHSPGSGKSRGGSNRPASSGKDRRPSIEIVEASPTIETRKPPRMPTATSSPANLKVPVSSRNSPPVHRSATTQHAFDNRREVPPMRRSETTPLTTSRHNDNMPSKSSKLRHAETHDSGYSSPGTPEMYQSSSPPKQSSTRYMIVEPDEDDFSRSHRTVLIDPDYSTSRRLTRSPSPHTRRPERPSVSTRGHKAPSRSATYTVSPDTTAPRPSLPRHESSRGGTVRSPPLSRNNSGNGNKLFGEVDPSEYKVRYSDDSVRYAKSHGPEHVNYGKPSPYERRGSSGQIPTRDRDSYAYRSSSDRPPPAFERSSTFAY